MATTPSYYGQWFVPASITYNGNTYATGGYSAPVTYNSSNTPSPPGTPQSASGSSSSTSKSRADLVSQFQLLMPWLNKTLINIYTDAWIQYGDTDLAMAAVRADKRYDALFPGLKNKDGSLKMTEGQYLSWVEGYKNALEPYGLSSLVTGNRVAQLLEGGVDPTEFSSRIDYVYTNVVTNLAEIKAAYAVEFGIDVNSLSLAAIFASAIDPEMSPVEMEFKIRKAQITGEASVAGFSVPVAEATRLAEFGLDQQAARSFYTQARTLLPTLGDLVGRHNDSDDTFDLSELTDALVFVDPEQQQRLSRLFAQEGSMFSTQQLFTPRNGALPGLTAD